MAICEYLTACPEFLFSNIKYTKPVFILRIWQAKRHPVQYSTPRKVGVFTLFKRVVLFRGDSFKNWFFSRATLSKSVCSNSWAGVLIIRYPPPKKKIGYFNIFHYLIRYGHPCRRRKNILLFVMLLSSISRNGRTVAELTQFGNGGATPPFFVLAYSLFWNENKTRKITWSIIDVKDTRDFTPIWTRLPPVPPFWFLVQ